MTTSEQETAHFLATYGLQAKTFSKDEMRSDMKTPDFRVFTGGDFQFFCEVKETTDADPLEDHFVEIDEDRCVAAQSKNDNATLAFRLAKHIHRAVKQFKPVNPDHKYPNALVFVNRYEMSNEKDLMELFSDSFWNLGDFVMTTAPERARASAQADRANIDLFLWLNRVPNDESYELFIWNRDNHKAGVLEALFCRLASK